jgi:hypothetical protein
MNALQFLLNILVISHHCADSPRLVLVNLACVLNCTPTRSNLQSCAYNWDPPRTMILFSFKKVPSADSSTIDASNLSEVCAFDKIIDQRYLDPATIMGPIAAMLGRNFVHNSKCFSTQIGFGSCNVPANNKTRKFSRSAFRELAPRLYRP